MKVHKEPMFIVEMTDKEYSTIMKIIAKIDNDFCDTHELDRALVYELYCKLHESYQE